MQDKKYIVFTQDEWNNNYLMGFYDDLDDAIPDINDWLEIYNLKLEKGDLAEYPSTFGTVFDKELETEDEAVLMVRGFILK